MSQQPFPQQPGQPHPGQPYPYPAEPAPQAKKKRRWPWILLAVVAVIVAMSVAGGGGEKTEEAATAATDTAAAAGNTVAPKTEAPKPAAKAAGLNTPVRDGKFEFTVTGVEAGLASVGDNPYLTQKAQGQFVVVSMKVTNIGTKPQGFSPSSQKVKDAQGRTFESDASAQIALGDSDVPVWDNINPGNTVEVKVVFDMPKGAVPATIELHDSMFSGGAKVALK